MAILQGGVVRRLPPQATKPCAVFSLYLIVPAFILVGLAKDGYLLYAGMFLFAVCKFTVRVIMVYTYVHNVL